MASSMQNLCFHHHSYASIHSANSNVRHLSSACHRLTHSPTTCQLVDTSSYRMFGHLSVWPTSVTACHHLPAGYSILRHRQHVTKQPQQTKAITIALAIGTGNTTNCCATQGVSKLPPNLRSNSSTASSNSDELLSAALLS